MLSTAVQIQLALPDKDVNRRVYAHHSEINQNAFTFNNRGEVGSTRPAITTVPKCMHIFCLKAYIPLSVVSGVAAELPSEPLSKAATRSSIDARVSSKPGILVKLVIYRKILQTLQAAVNQSAFRDCI